MNRVYYYFLNNEKSRLITKKTYVQIIGSKYETLQNISRFIQLIFFYRLESRYFEVTKSYPEDKPNRKHLEFLSEI
jgi:hypothetical protein